MYAAMSFILHLKNMFNIAGVCLNGSIIVNSQTFGIYIHTALGALCTAYIGIECPRLTICFEHSNKAIYGQRSKSFSTLK